jgi:hypothetical protein
MRILCSLSLVNHGDFSLVQLIRKQLENKDKLLEGDLFVKKKVSKRSSKIDAGDFGGHNFDSITRLG